MSFREVFHSDLVLISSQFVIWDHFILATVIAVNICHGYVCAGCSQRLGPLYGNEDSTPNTRPDTHRKSVHV